MVKDGQFREDLFYRLNVVRIVLPPLRERREDIPMLAHHFLHKVSTDSNQPVRGFVPETIALLERYHWPGNVRELENLIERTVSLAPGPLIMVDDLPEAVRKVAARSEANGDALLSLDEVEKRHLSRVLKETGGNKVRAAKILGIDRRTLYRMAKRFEIDLGEENAE